MYERIVVGTDGSAGGSAAVERAGELALAAANTAANNVEVHLVSCYHPLVGWRMGDFAGELDGHDADAEAMGQIARNHLVSAEAELQRLGLHERGIKVFRHAIIGTAFDGLLATAEQRDGDLIVVGSRGHGVGKRLLLGSVSTKIVHHATCSVLVVHNPGPED